MNSYGGCLFSDNPDYAPIVGSNLYGQRMESIR
jgi:hypothetical protein